MGKLIYSGINYNIIKYDDFTIEQKNGVRVTTFSNYEKAKKYIEKIDISK